MQEYSITYKTENHYENDADDAHWQFLIIPEENESQKFVEIKFSNSLNVLNQFSINGYGFKTIRVNPRQKFNFISFEGNFKVIKKDINPFVSDFSQSITSDYQLIKSHSFKIDYDSYLRETSLTTLPQENTKDYIFDENIPIFDNLQNLNKWVFDILTFKTNVTDVDTVLDEIITSKTGVCQDYTHLFCALSRINGIATRYVSGYINQGNGYFGDSQMHAWAEAYVPNFGWLGFDPTNNLLALTSHIKVCDGKDYNDCSPLKGIVYALGENKTSYTVQVSSQQQ